MVDKVRSKRTVELTLLETGLSTSGLAEDSLARSTLEEKVTRRRGKKETASEEE